MLTANAGPAPVVSWLHIREDTAQPIYQQLEAQLTALIQDGRIGAGATLPAERQLAESLGISRATVQRCYNTLRERGLIRGHGRHGSIVEGESARLLPGMDRLKGFTQEMDELGRKPSTKVLEREVVTNRQVASIFNRPSTARLLKLVRVRFGDDIPLSYETAWYSLDVAPFLEKADVTGSIYAQLAERGVALTFCDQTVEATSPTAQECEIFGFAEPVPCLLIKRRSYIRIDLMAEYVEGLFRGDTYTYRLRLQS
jgi:GntR family transcriptional regulator